MVSYNVKFNSFIFGRDLPKLIEALNADLLCLQEFPLRQLSGWKHHLRKLGYRHVLSQKTCETLLGIHQSNVIFSRHPLEDRHSVDLTFKDHETRKAQYCLVDIGEFQIFLLHTHLGLRRQERLFQMRKVVEILKNHSETEKMILLGDFNDWNNAGEEALGGHFNEAHSFFHGKAAQSFPAKMPLLRLDRIYFRNLTPAFCEVLKGKYIRKKSDHLPVRAGFQLL